MPLLMLDEIIVEITGAVVADKLKRHYRRLYYACFAMVIFVLIGALLWNTYA